MCCVCDACSAFIKTGFVGTPIQYRPNMKAAWREGDPHRMQIELQERMEAVIPHLLSISLPSALTISPHSHVPHDSKHLPPTDNTPATFALAHTIATSHHFHPIHALSASNHAAHKLSTPPPPLHFPPPKSHASSHHRAPPGLAPTTPTTFPRPSRPLPPPVPPHLSALLRRAARAGRAVSAL